MKYRITSVMAATVGQTSTSGKVRQMDNLFLQEYRAALIARAKALETEFACVVRIIQAIEKRETDANIKALMVLEREEIITGLYKADIVGVVKYG